MKYFDITVQTILFVIGLYSLNSCLQIIEYQPAGWMRDFLWVQLAMGVWQVFSSLGSLLGDSPVKKWKIAHLAISALYIGLLIAFNDRMSSPEGGDDLISILAYTVPAWILALYYYILCWVGILWKKNLLHTSF
jgi:hypothetical protein